ncbi:MAG: FimB/Mfa2 family fimbrial subunit, partial [Bacteroides sp.]|nr:FimB/Mfa2 family fimbrial subunit [Bacteroides sp.]
GFDNQADFAREDEYEIVIRMEQDVAFSITINGWEAVDITPDL